MDKELVRKVYEAMLRRGIPKDQALEAAKYLRKVFRSKDK